LRSIGVRNGPAVKVVVSARTEGRAVNERGGLVFWGQSKGGEGRWRGVWGREDGVPGRHDRETEKSVPMSRRALKVLTTL